MHYFIILLLVFALWIVWKYWTLLFGAGYDPTPMDKVYKMLNLAHVDKNDIVYDLGSGDGRIVLATARRFGANAVGIEVDPFRFVFSWFAVLLSGEFKRITLKFGNFFKKRIDDASVVTLFLFGPTNNKLKEKFMRELKSGTRIVSYVWPLDGWEVQDCLQEDRIYLYVVKKADTDSHSADKGKFNGHED